MLSLESTSIYPALSATHGKVPAYNVAYVLADFGSISKLILSNRPSFPQAPQCHQAFHITCAMNKNLRMEVVTRGRRVTQRFAYCGRHQDQKPPNIDKNERLRRVSAASLRGAGGFDASNLGPRSWEYTDVEAGQFICDSRAEKKKLLGSNLYVFFPFHSFHSGRRNGMSCG